MLERWPHDLAAALQACRRHVVTAAVFSLALNILHLAAPLYMMQVYDRVVSSGSGMTLAMLTLIVIAAYAALAGLDRARANVLGAASLRLDRLLAGPVFTGMMAEGPRGTARHAQALRDFDTCRGFVGGHAMTAVFDLPWLPLYVLIGFLLHWSVGVFILACGTALVAIAVASEMHVRSASREAQARAGAAHGWAEASLRNACSVRAMGMMPGLVHRWGRERNAAVTLQHHVGERTARMTALVRFLRLSMQSLVLGLGAWLFIEHAASAGAIFAGSLLLGRALQPVEQIIGQWQQLLAARGAFERVSALLTERQSLLPQSAIVREIGPPRLEVCDLVALAPGRRQPVLGGVSFSIEPGTAVGLVGPSGAGKSTLVRLLVGAAEPARGSVRLCGVEMARWSDRGGLPPIGYMPQELELFADTIAANIGRFGQSSDADVVRAAQMAGAHDMIASLPEGYMTVIGDNGRALSGGMRQRIALARAVLGRPPLVVLDEPSAHLDGEGEAALARCLKLLKAQGSTVIMVSHKSSTTALVDQFLVLIGGRLQASGTRAEVVRQLAAGAPPMRRNGAGAFSQAAQGRRR